MRLHPLLIIVPPTFWGAVALETSNSPFGASFFDGVDTALYQEAEAIILQGLASTSCDATTCLSTVADAFPCLFACIAIGSSVCIQKCLVASDLCTCLACLPDEFRNFIKKRGVCDSELKAELLVSGYSGLSINDVSEQMVKYGTVDFILQA